MPAWTSISSIKEKIKGSTTVGGDGTNDEGSESKSSKNVNSKWLGSEVGRASLEKDLREPEIKYLHKSQAEQQQTAMRIDLVRDGILDLDKTGDASSSRGLSAASDPLESTHSQQRPLQPELQQPSHVAVSDQVTDDAEAPELLDDMEKYGIE